MEETYRFSWELSTNYPAYRFSADKAIEGNLGVPHNNGFTYYDVETSSFTTSPYVSTSASPIATIKNEFYLYVGSLELDTETDAYKMLFMTSDGLSKSSYWLATRYIRTAPDNLYMGVHCINNDNCSGYELVSSSEEESPRKNYVRAVVTLAADVKLTENTTVEGTYDVTLAE